MFNADNYDFARESFFEAVVFKIGIVIVTYVFLNII